MYRLEKLIPYLDEIMSLFYKDMLSHEQFSVFFKSKDKIDDLIEKQTNNFIDSLRDTPDQFKSRYIRLGELHYTLRVPSADFLKSTKIWRGCFIEHAIHVIKDTDLVSVIEHYFSTMDMWMSKGYLDKLLEADNSDLEKLIYQYKDTDDAASEAALEHLTWLHQILQAIQFRDVKLAPELDIEKCAVHDVFCHPPAELLAIFSKEHFDDMHHRLHIDARSLFYFIDIDDYIEVLSVYSNLLSVYKITLITLGNITLKKTVMSLKNNLSKAKAEIKQLKGIIPICSYCHNIRNDEGAWSQLEKYISEHSEAQFSHGICPKCLHKVFEDQDSTK